MRPGKATESAVETVLAGLARVDASPATTESVRRRMHQEVCRQHRRRMARREAAARLPLRVAAATSAGVLLSVLYVVDVLRRAFEYWDR
ncbi:MAG: hypothetical protein AB1806_11040 [Acidobacteriota bacterium]